MNKEALKGKLLSVNAGWNLSEGTEHLTLTVSDDQLHATAKLLKEHHDLLFDYLVCLSGIDMPENCGVVYHLESSVHGYFLVLKAFTKNREQAELDSVADIWQTADFNEREVYDLVGITFKNHPDMRRIFLDEEDWVGHPLRKDYSDNNIVSR